jgi:hypothetical protein
MHTPGLRKVGARMYRDPNLPLPEGTQYTTEQNPSLQLRKPQSNLGPSELVPDQYNKIQPKVDMEGLQDVEVPEVTPEDFSFNDLQRFTGVQGPQEEPAARTNPYVNEFGFPVSAPAAEEVAAETPRGDFNVPFNNAGPMSDMSNLENEEDYFNELSAEQQLAAQDPTSPSRSYYQDVMQPNREVYPAGQMGEGIKATDYPEYLQNALNMNLDLPQDAFRPLPEGPISQEMLDKQEAQREAERQGITNEAVGAVKDVVAAGDKRLRQQEADAKRRVEEKIQKQKEQRQQQQNSSGNNQKANTRNTQGNAQQTNVGSTKQVAPNKKSNGVIDYGKDFDSDNVYSDLLKQGYTYGEIDAGLDFETGQFNPKKVEEYKKIIEKNKKEAAYFASPEGQAKAKKEERKRETQVIKEYGVPVYSNYQTKDDLFKAIQAGKVKPPSSVNIKGWENMDPTKLRNKEQELKLLQDEYNRWNNTNPDPNQVQDQVIINNKVYDRYPDGHMVISKDQSAVDGTDAKAEEEYWRQQEALKRQQEEINKMNQWRNFAYGGESLPMAQPGMITTANPNFVGLSDADAVDAQAYSQYFGNANNVTGNWWTGSPNIPRAQYGLNTAGANKYGYNYNPDSMDSEETQFKNWWDSQDKAKTDAMLADQERDLQAMNAYDINEDPADDSIGNNNPFAVKMKRKDMYNIDFPLLWGQAKGVAGMAQNIFNEATTGRRNTRNNLRNTYAETVEPTNQRRDLGNWHKLSGDYTPNQTGFDFDIQDRQSNAKHGGSMKDGHVTYMSAAQVKKFLAEGGELEFI